MTACPGCTAALPAGARFCPACGTPAPEVPAAREVRKTVTVLFADVTGSTALGEQLDPETLRALMARYFAVIRRVIEGHGGTVEKFIGDAVMAVFGIPQVHEDDALRAVRAAADIRAELAALNAELEAARGIAIRFRTGVHTGEVVAGDPAASETLVTGDTVNTAARLEQAAPPGEILLGQPTYRLVRDAVEAERVEPVAAKGKAEPVPAYRLVSVRAGAAGRARRLDAPLVGRERELARLDQAYRAAVADRTSALFTLLGTAGVGKSRLTAEFLASVEGEARVLRGRCLSYGEGITYWPIGEVVRAAAGVDDADDAEAARAKVRALLDEGRDADTIAARVASAIGLSPEPAPQEEIFWAVRRFLEHLAQAEPLVVVLEDIHWAEPTLLDLIEHLADWSREAPLLLLCPARPELLDTRPGWGGGKLNATTLLLEPLAPDATARLIDALPGGPALPAAVRDRVTAAAEGNPLYLEELLAMLVEDGRLRQDGEETWHATADLAAVPIPATVSALLAARLEQLPPGERAVAERASVVGRVFEQAAVAELSPPELRPQVQAALLGLVRKELLRPERGDVAAGDAFKFRHVLIRDAAYEALPKAERAVLHERLADWLERTVGDRLPEYQEVLGHHLAEAHRYRTGLGETGEPVQRLADRAGSALGAAGMRAKTHSDLAGADLLLTRAVALLPMASMERLALVIELGEVLVDLDPARGDDVLAEAIAVGRDLDQRLMAHAMVQRLHVIHHRQPAIFAARAREHVPAALAIFAESGDEAGMAKAWRALGVAEKDVARAEEAATNALRHVLLSDDAAEQELALQDWVIFGLIGATPISDALQRVDTVLARPGLRRLTRANLLGRRAHMLATNGEIEAAIELGTEAVDSMRQLGARLDLIFNLLSLGAIHIIAGTYAEAETAFREADSQSVAIGEVGLRPFTLARIAESLAEQGRDDEASEACRTVEAHAFAGDSMTEVICGATSARLLANAGRVTEAIDALRALVPIAAGTNRPTLHAYALAAFGAALLQAERVGEARDALEEALAINERKGNVVAARQVRERLAQVAARAGKTTR